MKRLFIACFFLMNSCYADNFYVGYDLGATYFPGTNYVHFADGTIFKLNGGSSSFNGRITQELKVGYLLKISSNWRYGIETSTVISPLISADNKYYSINGSYNSSMHMTETIKNKTIKVTTLLDYSMTPKFFGRVLGGIEYTKVKQQADIGIENLMNKCTFFRPYIGIGLRYNIFKKTDIGFSYNFPFTHGKFSEQSYLKIGFNYNIEG